MGRDCNNMVRDLCIQYIQMYYIYIYRYISKCTASYITTRLKCDSLKKPHITNMYSSDFTESETIFFKNKILKSLTNILQNKLTFSYLYINNKPC